MAIDRNDPEVKALIEDVVKEATEALATKNRELLGEVKTLKAKAKGADIDPAEHAALQQQVEELTDKLAKSEKAFKGETEKLTKALSEKDGSLRQILVDQGLTEYAVKAGVASHYLEAVKAIHGPKVQIEQKDGQMVAMLNNEFRCVPSKDTVFIRFFPDFHKRFPYVCRIAVPPFFGEFAGFITVALNRQPNPAEYDSLKIEMNRVAIELYLRDISKKPVS